MGFNGFVRMFVINMGNNRDTRFKATLKRQFHAAN